jgi:hypothetical protein
MPNKEAIEVGKVVPENVGKDAEQKREQYQPNILPEVTVPIELFVGDHSSLKEPRQVVDQSVPHEAMKEESQCKAHGYIQPEHAVPGVAVDLYIGNEQEAFKIGYHAPYHQSGHRQLCAQDTVDREHHCGMCKSERHSTKISASSTLAIANSPLRGGKAAVKRA